IVHFVIEVVDGDAEVGKRRREHDTGALGLGGFRLQLTGTATGVDGSAAVACGSIGFRNAGGGAVGTQLVIAAFTPADARIDLGLGPEAALVAQVRLVQARCAVGGADGAACAQGRDDLPVQAQLPDVVRTIHRVVFENTAGGV